jgi:ABC-type antimicrobial peptide transport system permease subunit
VAATFGLTQLLQSHGPADIGFYDLTIDWNILFQSFAAIMSAGILTGIGPALLETRTLQANPLRLATSDRARQRWRSVLVVFEIAVTLSLLVVTCMIVDMYRRTLSWNYGFDTSHVIVANVNSTQAIPTDDVRHQLMTLPGVKLAAASTATPQISQGVPERASLNKAGSGEITARKSFIDSNFFPALDVHVRQGRMFNLQENNAKGAGVVIVNEVMAAQLWPNQSALGKSIWINGIAYEIVGVASNISEHPLGRPRANVYLPLSELPEAAKELSFTMQTSLEPVGLVEPIRKELLRIQPGAVISVRTADSLTQAAASEVATTVYPMTPLIATGLLLTATGIYGVLAFAVARRSKELAIRMAIGASPKHMLRLVSGISARLIGTGVFFGLGLMYGLSRIAQNQGGPFATTNVWVFVAPFAVVAAIGIAATLLPCRRVLSLDATAALRTE